MRREPARARTRAGHPPRPAPERVPRLITAPGELGLGRAYVSGKLDVEGDLYAALSALRDRIPDVRAVGARQWADVLALARSSLVRSGLKPLPAPPQEADLTGVRHSKQRDAAAIAHHYDVPNAFYRIVLGPSMTYSCAVWERPDVTLEQAQAAKVIVEATNEKRRRDIAQIFATSSRLERGFWEMAHTLERWPDLVEG